MTVYTLTVNALDGAALHTEMFGCKREATAFARGAEVFARTPGAHTAKLTYSAMGGAHSKHLYNGTWRNEYHHATALAKAGLSKPVVAHQPAPHSMRDPLAGVRQATYDLM